MHVRTISLELISIIDKCDEGFGLRLCSIHNIRFLIRIVEGARKAIEEDRFLDYKNQVMKDFGNERGF